jgi:microcin C transport system substrate-binding protein
MMSARGVPARETKNEVETMKTIRLRAALAVLSVVALVGLSAPAFAQEREWLHGITLMDTLKHGPDFQHFDSVNPNAPKGGRVRFSASGSFDSLNPYTVKGDPAAGTGVIYDTLMADSLDEPGTMYGLIAESVSHPDDFSSATFRLRPQARWHDGVAITPEDVIFSLDTLRNAHPFFQAYYANIASVEKTGDHEVTFTFDQAGNRELPHITGQLVILPKHYWEGSDARGNPRDFNASTLEVPLGSGPYRIASVDPPRGITYERVEDYWGADLPVNVGTNNFDRITYTYFRDATVLFEAFKGDQFDFHVEATPKFWIEGYNFDAVSRGWIVKDSYSSDYPERMQAFVFNTRVAALSDRRVRHAFNLAFNFEWTNETISYGLNHRVDSYFDESELAATGLPEGRELEILETVRGQVPEEVFTTEYQNPVHTDRTATRGYLREARATLEEAGWKIEGRVLRNVDTGEAMSVEFLLVSPAFEPHVLAYKENLEKLGIEVKVRVVDSAQYQRRVQEFDYDIIVGGWSQSLSPGNEQRESWGSESASRPGSRNYAGIADPAIDTLIDRLIYATDRDDLVAATRALDRVLLWNHYVVPQWYRETLYARWDRFGRPDRLPVGDMGYPTVWWYDAERAARIKPQ